MSSVPEFFLADRVAAAMLIELALAEDLRDVGDLTSQAIIDAELTAEIDVVARKSGVLAGTPVAELVLSHVDPETDWNAHIDDGMRLEPGTVIATVSGSVQSLLKAERTVLNFLTELSGVATLTAQFVEAVGGTKAVILDTRKTWPGWRCLQKYAVRAGGGTNHRMGLFDGVLIKDNHLAAWSGGDGRSIAEAVRQARATVPEGISIEVEVDTLDQLQEVLPAEPEIVLLDNMSPEELRRAVETRNETASQVLLEASGGVTLETVRSIAETGVDRISIGALTHSVTALDIGFDWKGFSPK